MDIQFTNTVFNEYVQSISKEQRTQLYGKIKKTKLDFKVAVNQISSRTHIPLKRLGFEELKKLNCVNAFIVKPKTRHKKEDTSHSQQQKKDLDSSISSNSSSCSTNSSKNSIEDKLEHITNNLEISKKEDMNSSNRLTLVNLFDDDATFKIAEHKISSRSPVNISNVKKILADASRRKSLFQDERNAKELKKTDNKDRRKSIFEDYDERKSLQYTKKEEICSSHSSDKVDKRKNDEKTEKIKSDKNKEIKRKKTIEGTKISETKHSNDKISTPKSSNEKIERLKSISEDNKKNSRQSSEDRKYSGNKQKIDKDKTKTDHDKRSSDDNKNKNPPIRKSIYLEQPPEHSLSIQTQDTPSRKSMYLEQTPKSRTPKEDKNKDIYSRRKSICVDKPSNIEDTPKSRTKVEHIRPAKIFERRQTMSVTTPVKKKEMFSFFHAPPLRKTRSKSTCFIDDSEEKNISPTTKSINKKMKIDDFIDDSDLIKSSRSKVVPPKLSRCKSLDNKDPTTPKKKDTSKSDKPNLFDDSDRSRSSSRSQSKEKVSSKRSRSKSIDKKDPTTPKKKETSKSTHKYNNSDNSDSSRSQSKEKVVSSKRSRSKSIDKKDTTPRKKETSKFDDMDLSSRSRSQSNEKIVSSKRSISKSIDKKDPTTPRKKETSKYLNKQELFDDIDLSSRSRLQSKEKVASSKRSRSKSIDKKDPTTPKKQETAKSLGKHDLFEDSNLSRSSSRSQSKEKVVASKRSRSHSDIDKSKEKIEKIDPVKIFKSKFTDVLETSSDEDYPPKIYSTQASKINFLAKLEIAKRTKIELEQKTKSESRKIDLKRSKSIDKIDSKKPKIESSKLESSKNSETNKNLSPKKPRGRPPKIPKLGSETESIIKTKEILEHKPSNQKLATKENKCDNGQSIDNKQSSSSKEKPKETPKKLTERRKSKNISSETSDDDSPIRYKRKFLPEELFKDPQIDFTDESRNTLFVDESSVSPKLEINDDSDDTLILGDNSSSSKNQSSKNSETELFNDDDSPKSDDNSSSSDDSSRYSNSSSSFLPQRTHTTAELDFTDESRNTLFVDESSVAKFEINDDSDDTVILGEKSSNNTDQEQENICLSRFSSISQPTNEERVPERSKSRLESFSEASSQQSHDVPSKISSKRRSTISSVDIAERLSANERQKASQISSRRSSSKENVSSTEDSPEKGFYASKTITGYTIPKKSSVGPQEDNRTSDSSSEHQKPSKISCRRSSSKENVSSKEDRTTVLQKIIEEKIDKLFETSKRLLGKSSADTIPEKKRRSSRSKSPESIKPAKIFPTSETVSRRISLEDTIPDPVINYGDLLKQMKNTPTNKTIDFVAPLTAKTKIGFSKPAYDKDSEEAMSYDSVIVIPEDKQCNRIIVRRKSVEEILQNTRKVIERRHSFHFEDMPLKQEEDTNENEKTKKPKKAKRIRHRRKTVNEFDLSKKPKKSILKKRPSPDLITSSDSQKSTQSITMSLQNIDTHDTSSNQSITINLQDIDKIFPSVSNEEIMTLEVSSDDNSSSSKDKTISTNKKDKHRKDRLSSDSALGEDIDTDNVDVINSNLPDMGKLPNMPTIDTTESTVSKTQGVVPTEQAVNLTRDYFVSLLFIYNRYYKEKMEVETQKMSGIKPDITSRKEYFTKRHKSDMAKLYKKLIKIHVRHFSLILFFDKMMTLLKEEFRIYEYITEIVILFFLRKTIWTLMENFTSPSDEKCLFNHITSCDAVDFLLAKEKFKHNQITEKDKFLMQALDDFSYAPVSPKSTIIQKNVQTYVASNRLISSPSQNSTNENIPTNFIGTDRALHYVPSVPTINTQYVGTNNVNVQNLCSNTPTPNIVQTRTGYTQNIRSNNAGTNQVSVLRSVPNYVRTAPMNPQYVGTNPQPNRFSPNIVPTNVQYFCSNPVGTNQNSTQPGNAQNVRSNVVSRSQRDTQVVPAQSIDNSNCDGTNSQTISAKSVQNVPTIPVHNQMSDTYQNQFVQTIGAKSTQNNVPATPVQISEIYQNNHFAQVRENLRNLQAGMNVQRTSPQTNIPTSVQTISNRQTPNYDQTVHNLNQTIKPSPESSRNVQTNVPTRREQNSVQTTSHSNVQTRQKQNSVQTKSNNPPNYIQAVQDLNKGIKIIDVVVTKPNEQQQQQIKQRTPRIKLVDERILKNSVPVENSLAQLLCTSNHNNDSFGTLSSQNIEHNQSQQNNRISTRQDTIIEDQMAQRHTINAQNTQQKAQTTQQMAQHTQQMPQNTQKMAQNTQQMPQNTQMAQNPQQLAQNPQQLAQNPQQLAQNTHQMAQNTQQMPQNRRYIRAPVQNVPVSMVQPNSRTDSEETNIMAQMVQQYQRPPHQKNDALMRKLLTQQNASRTGAQNPNVAPNRNGTYTENQRLAMISNWYHMAKQQLAHQAQQQLAQQAQQQLAQQAQQQLAQQAQQQLAQQQIVPPQIVPPPKVVPPPQVVPNLIPTRRRVPIPQQRQIPHMDQQMVPNEMAPYPYMPCVPTYNTQITNNFTINSNMPYNIQQQEIANAYHSSGNGTTQMARHSNVLPPQGNEIAQNQNISQPSGTNFGVTQQSYDMNSATVSERTSQQIVNYRMKQAAMSAIFNHQNAIQDNQDNHRDNQDQDQNTSLRNVSRDSGYFSPVDNTQNSDSDQFCERCLKPSNLMCSGCYTYYCSVVCQSLAWPEHKKQCFTRS